MFKVSGAIFLASCSTSAFGITLFSREKSNYLFVAESDNYFYIERFAPIADKDGFQFIQYDDDQNLYNLGDKLPISSNTPTFGFVCKNIQFYLEKFKLADFLYSPSFCLQLSKLLGEKRGRDEAIPLASQKIFSNDRIAHTWKFVEESSTRDDIVFWNRQDHDETFKEFLLSHNIGGLDEALAWIGKRRNYAKAGWPKIWTYVRSIAPFSEELGLITADWLVQGRGGETEEQLRQFRFVAFRHVLECLVSTKELGGLAGVLVEEIELNDVVLLYLMGSQISFQRLLTVLEEGGYFGFHDRIMSLARLMGLAR